MLLLSYITKKVMQKNLPPRQDNNKYITFTPITKFPDLNEEFFSFKEGKYILRGSKYYNRNIEKYSGIVVFFHGMLGGRKQYNTQIFTLAQAGFIVYAYDNLTCGDSDGDNWFHIYSSIKDMDTFFKYFKHVKKLDLPIYAVGHSWGGFTALNTVFTDYPVTKIVEMSGFYDALQATIDISPAASKFKFLLKMTAFRYYGKYYRRNVFKELGKTNKSIMFAHGEKDNVVFYDTSFKKIKEKYGDRKNFRFLSVPEHYHQVFMTLRGEKYGNDIYSQGLPEGKYPADQVDFDIFFEQDDEFIQKVIDFLKE